MEVLLAVELLVEFPIIVPFAAFVEIDFPAPPTSKLTLVEVADPVDDADMEEPLSSAKVVARMAVVPLLVLVVEYVI